MNTIIIFGFVICVIMSVIHLMYQYVVLPTLMQPLKFKFHKLHDEVISLVIDDKSKIKPLEFNITMHMLNVACKNLPNYNLSIAFESMKLLKSKSHETSINIDKIQDLEKQIHNERLKEIHEESLNIAFKAFIYNTFMLLIYLLPLFILIYIASCVFGYGKNLKTLYIEWINNNMESNFNLSSNERNYSI